MNLHQSEKCQTFGCMMIEVNHFKTLLQRCLICENSMIGGLICLISIGRLMKFVPAYNKFGSWHFCNESMDIETTEWWFARQKLSSDHQTTIIPFNCRLCPSWMRNTYVKCCLFCLFSPIKKEF